MGHARAAAEFNPSNRRMDGKMPLGHSHISKGTKKQNDFPPVDRLALCCMHSIDRSNGSAKIAPRPEEMIIQFDFATLKSSHGRCSRSRLFVSSRNSEISPVRETATTWKMRRRSHFQWADRVTPRPKAGSRVRGRREVRTEKREGYPHFIGCAIPTRKPEEEEYAKKNVASTDLNLCRE